MGIVDISEINRDPKLGYKPWFGKFICSYITSNFNSARRKTDYVKTVLNVLSRNLNEENWTLNSKTNITNILIVNSDKKKISKKLNFNIKKTYEEKALKKNQKR